ncbi:preprotein translocase subunit SecG [Alkaliphilus hydrothermalis]|uniref:Protein-export membrane protein SecG n=1 Tax=Alkaliphilus hydrothermalis TaxID=1482730 RepID=A0ABS2NNF2_9FIRM|nr:preprotein translocase subunit SecG [Alkaliphilus hydrothermalis]MBM7614357.1 preprotein translocase subunit SecG [Alkaliphilus hydrothermalis]
MLKTILMVIQVITSIILIGSILLQSGKSQGLSGAIGGGAEQVWGKQARGYEGVLSKVTSVAAALFIIVAITLVAIQ